MACCHIKQFKKYHILVNFTPQDSKANALIYSQNKYYKCPYLLKRDIISVQVYPTNFKTQWPHLVINKILEMPLFTQKGHH